MSSRMLTNKPVLILGPRIGSSAVGIACYTASAANKVIYLNICGGPLWACATGRTFWIRSFFFPVVLYRIHAPPTPPPPTPTPPPALFVVVVLFFCHFFLSPALYFKLHMLPHNVILGFSVAKTETVGSPGPVTGREFQLCDCFAESSLPELLHCEHQQSVWFTDVTLTQWHGERQQPPFTLANGPFVTLLKGERGEGEQGGSGTSGHSLTEVRACLTEAGWHGRTPYTHTHTLTPKLQALVYDILPSTTAVFSYALGPWKLSANEQFFVGAQTVVSLLQTTQIKRSVSFIATNKVYTSTNKTTIVWIETELCLLFLPEGDASHVYVRALALGCVDSHISTQTPSTGLRHPSFNHCRF